MRNGCICLKDKVSNFSLWLCNIRFLIFLNFFCVFKNGALSLIPVSSANIC